MKPPTERLKLVTDFGELRAGMIVVVKPCAACGATQHRAQVQNPVTGSKTDQWGRDNEAAMKLLPTPIAHDRIALGVPYAVTPICVKQRIVHRVLDNLEDDQAHTTTKKRAPREHVKGEL